MQELKSSLINSWTEQEKTTKESLEIYRRKCMNKIEYDKDFHKYLQQKLSENICSDIGSFNIILGGNFFWQKLMVKSVFDDDIINDIKKEKANFNLDGYTRCQIFADILTEKMKDIGIRFTCDTTGHQELGKIIACRNL